MNPNEPDPSCPSGYPEHPYQSAREVFFEAVSRERTRQDKKWGIQYHTLPEWMLILAEEQGEAAKAANERVFRGESNPGFIKELVEEVAVALAIYEAIKEGRVISRHTSDDSLNISQNRNKSV